MIDYPFGAGQTLTRVIEAGSGTDHVVFLHGLGARADRWRPTVEAAAAEGFHCYAIDLPGHGFAAKDDGFPYGVPGYVAFLRDFLDAMSIEKAFLVGTSLGGHVAAYLACETPERVRALVMVGAVGLIPIGAEAGDLIRRNIRETGRDKIMDKFKFVFCDHALITPALIEEEYRINNSPGAKEGFVRLGDYIAEEIDQDNVGERLAGLVGSIPMLLVWGGEDKAVPVSVGEQAKALLGSPDLVVIPECGHAPYLEKPAEFNRSVFQFLADIR